MVQENANHRSERGKGEISQQTAFLQLYVASKSLVYNYKWYKSSIKL